MHAKSKMNETFSNVRADFEIILHSAMQVSQGMQGVTTNEAGQIADQLLARNIITGLTIEMILNPPQRTGYSGMPAHFTVWDLPSLCVLARGILETYLALHYIAVQNVSATEREFRLFWWNWHETNERLWLLETLGSTNPKLNDLRRQRDELSRKILCHPQFATLSPKLQKEFRQGKGLTEALLRTKREIAVDAGIDQEQFQIAYKYLSQFAHSQPMATSIFDGFKTGGPESLEQMALPTRYATSYLLLSVRDYVAVFPEANRFINTTFRDLMTFWSDIHKGNLKSVKCDPS